MKKMNVGVALQGDPQTGITLIALIITIIVMLILVGVTINVALNGGLFEKAKTASIQTEIAQIQEQLVLAKAEKIADNNGYDPTNYGIALSDLDLSESIKTKYANKLTISKDGTLYYTESATAQEIVYFENAGITAEGTNTEVEDTEVEDELGELFLRYYINNKTSKDEDVSNEIIQSAEVLGVTRTEFLTTLSNVTFFGKLDENCSYGYGSLNGIYYLYRGVGSNIEYIKQSNTEKYAMLSNLLLIESELSEKLSGKTRAEIEEIFSTNESAEAFVKENSQAVINDVNVTEDTINGAYSYNPMYNDQNVCYKVVLVDL